MADITLDAANSSANARAMRSMVFTTTTIGYYFFIDNDLDFKYLKTTDGGQTWGGLTTIYTGSLGAYDVWFDQWTPGDTGTLIHTWYIETGTDDVRYRTLDTNGDSLGTERVVFAGDSVVTGIGVFVSGAKARGGNLLCAFDLDAGAETGTYRSTDGGVNWGVRANLVEATIDRLLMFPGNETDNQDMWALYLDASTDELTLKMHDDSADTNNESANIMTVVDNTTDVTGQNPMSGAIRHSDNHLIIAALSERDPATPVADFRVFDITGTGGITEKTALATDTDDCYYPSVFVDVAGSIFVVYIGKRDGSETLGTTAGVYYTRSFDGGTTWTGGDTVYSTAAGDYFQTYAPLNGPRFMAAWRDLSATSLLSNYDNSITITAASDNQLAFLKGEANASDNQLAFLKGVASTVDNQLAFLKGTVNTADNQPGYLRGDLSASAAQDAYLSGALGATDNSSAFLHGVATTSANQGAFARGELSDADNQLVFLAGSFAVTDGQPSFLAGMGEISSFTPVYARGRADVLSVQPVFAAGRLGANSGQRAYLSAPDLAMEATRIYRISAESFVYPIEAETFVYRITPSI